MYHIALSKAVDFSQAGGKAANLARAVQLGFQVPEGFALSRAALRFFLETNRFLPNVRTTLEGYDGLEWRERMERFEALRAAALKLPIPRAVQAEVEPLFLELLDRSPAGVAVRSSSVCEDLEMASFAGIYASFLGMITLEDFWQSVVRCWCSTWSPQAVAHAQKMGILISIDSIGVLVQTLIPAESSGVAFTVDPVTGNLWHFVLNATFGLAPRLVDGSAPADRFVLAWDNGEILEKRIVRKPGALVFQDERVCEVALPERQPQTTSLSDEQAQAVGKMALAADRTFDRRMDLE